MPRMALNDLNAIRGMADIETFVDEVFGFHAQQASEKSLKAWIAALGEEYPLTHNLFALLNILQSTGADTQPYLGLTEYTPFGVRFRYEPLGSEDEPLDRRE